MKKLLLMFLLVALSISQANAQEETRVQTTAAPFLLIVPDARSGGMADMGVATSSDANSQFFNASKYAFMEEDMSIGINYTPWMRNLTDNVFLGSFSFAKRINERSTWGVGFRYFTTGSIQLFDGAGNSMGSENPNELALDGSYSLKLSEHFSMAVTGRFLRSDNAVQIENSDLKTVNTVTADIGAYYQSDLHTLGKMMGVWRAGLALSNIGAEVELVEGAPKSQLPTNLKLGAGYEFMLDDINSVTANMELNSLLVSNNDLGNLIYAFGAEYKYKNVFSLRTGYFHEPEDNGNRQFATLGGGLAFRNTRLDLSYLFNTSDVRSPLENTLRFSLSFAFGNKTNVPVTDEIVSNN